MTREEAINLVKQVLPCLNIDEKIREGFETLIPELAESEDERMLREIKRYIKEQGDKPTGLPNGTVAISDMIAWLEKQKEHKPSGETNVEPDSKIPREEYLYHLLANHIITFTDYTYLLAKKPFDYECANIPQKDYTPVEQKPADLSEMMVHKEPYIAPVPTPMVADEQKPEWSEEDENCIRNLESVIYYDKNLPTDTRIKLGDFLKSLRPQQRQEWSEEEKEILDNILSHYVLIDKPTDANGIPKEKYISLIKSIRFDTYKNCNSYWKPSEEQKYDGNMDKECIKLCDILNSIPSVNTFESCCGHLKDRFSVWFFCNDTVAISRLGRSVDRNYSDGKWELLVDSTDTHPTGVFWLRSKVPFQSYDEMEESVNELCVGIQYWFSTEFDSYFNGNSCK